MAPPDLRLPVPVSRPVRTGSHLDPLVVSATFRATSRPNNPTVPPASARDLASPPPYADLFRPVAISMPLATFEDPMDGQNAAIEGTNPGRGPTTGGIEIRIYFERLYPAIRKIRRECYLCCQY